MPNTRCTAVSRAVFKITATALAYVHLVSCNFLPGQCRLLFLEVTGVLKLLEGHTPLAGTA